MTATGTPSLERIVFAEFAVQLNTLPPVARKDACVRAKADLARYIPRTAALPVADRIDGLRALLTDAVTHARLGVA